MAVSNLRNWDYVRPRTFVTACTVAVIVCNCQGSDLVATTVAFVAVATTIAVGYVRTRVVFARERCACLLLQGVAAAVSYDATSLPPGFRPARQMGAIVGNHARAYALLSLCL